MCLRYDFYVYPSHGIVHRALAIFFFLKFSASVRYRATVAPPAKSLRQKNALHLDRSISSMHQWLVPGLRNANEATKNNVSQRWRPTCLSRHFREDLYGLAHATGRTSYDLLDHQNISRVGSVPSVMCRPCTAFHNGRYRIYCRRSKSLSRS